MGNSKPLLIYDGDCGFCAYWVQYWQKLTDDRVVYAPYQEVGDQYPKISKTAFRHAIQYVAPDGKVSSAAEASFLTLSHAPGKGFWLWLYRQLPGFALVSEWAYAFIAARRPLFHKLSLWLWGRDYAPPKFELVSWLFLRLMGFMYLFAFVSFGVQAMGLIGSHGILPLADFISSVRGHYGTTAYSLAPMVFWWNASDGFIEAVCWGGALISLLLIVNVLPRTCLILLYVLYLSLLYAGQDFMTFQWDTLLLETGFLSLLLSLNTTTCIWLVRWLLFRFMFLSGSVKLLSGDATWHNLSALSYHFQTQPLPTPLGWYANLIPPQVLTFMTGATFVVELGLPFLIFTPRRLRFIAAAGFLLLEALIFLTGNYNFFNLLTMLLCLVLFDDAALYTATSKYWASVLKKRIKAVKPHRIFSVIVGSFAVLIVLVSCLQMYSVFHGRRLSAVASWVEPYHIVNTYGLFAVMTTKRPEIIIEGSNDGTHWSEYGFKYKPGDINRSPLWNIPHQPRLDWQMWFAALGSAQQNPWLVHFMEQILRGSPDVLALMGSNPFPDKPPLYVRAEFYDYRYATPEEKAETGAWWQRQLIGIYFPEASLR